MARLLISVVKLLALKAGLARYDLSGWPGTVESDHSPLRLPYVYTERLFLLKNSALKLNQEPVAHGRLLLMPVKKVSEPFMKICICNTKNTIVNFLISTMPTTAREWV